MKTAALYRMVMPKHICPYGLKSLDLLKREGYEVEDHYLKTREETDAFKTQHDVKTTPQVFIDGKRIGGYTELRAYFGKALPDPKTPTYRPVIALFSIAFLMSVAANYAVSGSFVPAHIVQWFIAFSMCLLALEKLKNIETFSTMFLNYDLLAQKYVPYARIYPFAEALAGILMIAGVMTWIAAPLALLIGTIGAVSVFKAVYIDKRELKCACVGGDSNVPLGFVSLLESLMMIAMAVWMMLAG